MPMADITNQLRKPYLLRPLIASESPSTHKAQNSQQGLVIVGVSTRNKFYLPNTSVRGDRTIQAYDSNTLGRHSFKIPFQLCRFIAKTKKFMKGMG